MMVLKPLTPAETEVADLRGKGWDCPRIADWLGISPGTVRSHIKNASMKLSNPDNLDPMDQVMLWAAHRAWLISRQTAA